MATSRETLPVLIHTCAHTRTHRHVIPRHEPHQDNAKSFGAAVPRLGLWVFPKSRWPSCQVPCHAAAIHPPGQQPLRCHADFSTHPELLMCLWYTPCVPTGKHTLISSTKCSRCDQSWKGKRKQRWGCSKRGEEKRNPRCGGRGAQGGGESKIQSSELGSRLLGSNP